MLRRGVPAGVRLPRAGLVARAVPRPVTLVEAPGGYGKTTLATLVAEHLDRLTVHVVADRGVPVVASVEAGLRAVGLRPMVGAAADAARLADVLTGSGRPVLVVVDELQRCDDDDQRWCVDLLAQSGPDVGVMLLGRRLGRRVAAWSDARDVRPLGVDDLAFDLDDVAELLAAAPEGAPSDAGLVRAATQGWPAAVVLAGASGRTAPGAGVTGGAEVVAGLVSRLLAELPGERADAVAAVGSLPLLSAHVASVLAGPGALDALLDAGIPVRWRDDGWGEVAQPVRAVLDTHVTVAFEPLRRVAVEYARAGEALTGALLLGRVGDPGGVASLLAGLPRPQLVELGLPALDSLLAGVDDDALAPAAAVLADAALAADGADPARRAAWLARGLRVATDPATRRALLAEQARDLQRELRLDEADAIAAEVLREARPQERRTRGRAHFVAGLSRLVREQAAASPATVDHLERAVAELALAHEPALEAEALRCLASGVHHNAGRYAVAVAQLERAVSLLPGLDLPRALELLYLAESLRETGRLDRAATLLDESWAIGRRLGAERALGYAAWSQALLAADRRDREAVEDWVAAALTHRGTWYDAGAGIDFLANVAEMRLLVGDLAGADLALAEARVRAAGTGYEWPILSAQARRDAAHGEPAVALDAVDRLAAMDVGRERPLVALLRAVALQRAGSTQEAAAVLEQARRAARALDDPGRLERREPELLALLGAPVPAPRRRRVDVLGGLRVVVDGADRTPPPGLPRRLVGALAVASPRPVDEVVELLWPDAAADVGRPRLRNLLNRVRAAGADVLERRGDALVLAADVDVDLARLRRALDAVAAASPEVRPGLARAALVDVASFDLLPEERYEAWCERDRAWVQRRGLTLLDEVASDALARGDLGDAADLLERGAALDPADPERLRRLATVLRRQGRARTAADLDRRAAALDD